MRVNGIRTELTCRSRSEPRLPTTATSKSMARTLPWTLHESAGFWWRSRSRSSWRRPGRSRRSTWPIASLWGRCGRVQPGRGPATELVTGGAIGEVCTGSRGPGLRRPADLAPQSYHPERGDSLLFHLGVYPVLFPDASGRPEAVVVH